MCETYKATIKDFDHDLFVIALANRENLSDLEISQRVGIRNAAFKLKVKEKFEKFASENEYCPETVEAYFNVKFSFLRIEKGKILSFEGTPSFSAETIYVHKK